VAKAIRLFYALAEAEAAKKLRVLRMNRDGEFSSVEFAAYCAD
jgi:hypothetical protein